MGLTTTLGNALSGMSATQRGLEVVSRNVANSGTPGYHRQTLALLDGQNANSSYAKTAVVQRAFNGALQVHYTQEVADAAAADVTARYLDRLQTLFGRPGDAISLDSVLGKFANSLQALGTSPESHTVRAEAVGAAQALAERLQSLSSAVQGLRQETEAQIGSAVTTLNTTLSALTDVNRRIVGQGGDAAAQAALLDERDRLVSQIAEQIDVQASYRNDGSVALMTRTGVGLLDGQASTFTFQPAGRIGASDLFSADGAQNGVGSLTLTTPSGLTLDLVGQNVLVSGTLGGLVTLRDKALVAAQAQLDEVAAGLAQALSSVTVPGMPAASGGGDGLALELGQIQPGNDFTLTYTQNGNPKAVRVVRVDDPAKLPMDTTDASGQRVIGLDFSGGAAGVAAGLGLALGPGSGLQLGASSASALRVLDDGASNTTNVTGLSARVTVGANQDAGAALSLFVDGAGGAFTNSLDGAGQKLGFAARITVNGAVLADNRLLVQSSSTGSVAETARATQLRDGLNGARFASLPSQGGQRLSGTVADLVAQTLNLQGSAASAAQASSQTRTMTLQALDDRMQGEYGVNVDDEMARLMELQNAFAANARVISVVSELLDALLAI